MKLKRGVTLAGIKIEMRPVLIAADAIWQEHGKKLVVTSSTGGAHSAGSFHYYGYALDLRSWYFSRKIATEVTRKLRLALGSDYDVVNEGTHIHVEYDPKERNK